MPKQLAAVLVLGALALILGPASTTYAWTMSRWGEQSCAYDWERSQTVCCGNDWSDPSNAGAVSTGVPNFTWTYIWAGRSVDDPTIDDRIYVQTRAKFYSESDEVTPWIEGEWDLIYGKATDSYDHIEPPWNIRSHQCRIWIP